MVALEGRKMTGVVYIMYDTLSNFLYLVENGNICFCGMGSFILFLHTVLGAGKKVKKKPTSLLFTSELVNDSIYDTVRKGLPEDGINSSIFLTFEKESYLFYK